MKSVAMLSLPFDMALTPGIDDFIYGQWGWWTKEIATG